MQCYSHRTTHTDVFCLLGVKTRWSLPTPRRGYWPSCTLLVIGRPLADRRFCIVLFVTSAVRQAGHSCWQTCPRGPCGAGGLLDLKLLLPLVIHSASSHTLPSAHLQSQICQVLSGFVLVVSRWAPITIRAALLARKAATIDQSADRDDLPRRKSVEELAAVPLLRSGALDFVRLRLQHALVHRP